MKEVKKTAGKKKSNTQNKQVREVRDEKPVVKEIKTVKVDKKDKEDNRLVIVIAVAILVIVGTVIGLLVGCQKQEKEVEKKKVDDVIVPIKNDTVADEDDDDDEVKVTKTSTSSKSSSNKKKTYYNVKYYYGDGFMHHEKVLEGKSAKNYEPKGYNSCTAYADKNYTEKYNMNKSIKSNTNIYLDCEAEIYNVVYVYEEGTTTNPTTFTANDKIALDDLQTNGKFLGWYLDNTNGIYNGHVTELSRKLRSEMDETNTITLYAKVLDILTVTYENEDGSETKSFDVNINETYKLEDNIFDIENFLGWTTTYGSKSIINNPNMNLTEDVTFYPVVGDVKIMYDAFDQTVVIAYDEEEIEDDEFELPEPEAVGIEPTTYVVPVEEETETSKTVVSDDDIEIDLLKQMALQEAKDKAIDGYDPQLGDIVEELPEEFQGWKVFESGLYDENDKPIVEEEFTTTEEVVEDLEEKKEEKPDEVPMEILIAEESDHKAEETQPEEIQPEETIEG